MKYLSQISLLFFLFSQCTADAQLPLYPPTYQTNSSTIIQPCNDQGFMDPKTTEGWGYIDFDWSNAKKYWAVKKPMDCAEMLLLQVEMTKAASPKTKTWVYRNSIKALPWYTKVRETLEDPAYSPWFMKFDPNVSSYHVPVCDTNYHPPLCSKYYHDQTQTPGFPTGDGNCAAPACDVGSIPIGEYLWDHRQWNTSVNGETFGEWFIEKYVFDETGGRNPLVSGFFFDDHWRLDGPSEFEPHCLQDMGLTKQDLVDLTNAYNSAMNEVKATVRSRGLWSWQQLSTVVIHSANCMEWLKRECHANATLQNQFMYMRFNSTRNDPSHIPFFYEDLAIFLLIRGPYAVIGHDWLDCNKVYYFHPDLNKDYGVPTGLCSEVSSGVFVRHWTNVDVQMDCNTYTPKFTWK